MEIASARDWIIVLVGALEILFIIGFLIILLIIYSKVNKLIKQGKETIERIERTVTSPYYKAGSLLFKIIAKGLGIFQKKEKGRNG